MSKTTTIRSGFVLVEDFFDPETANKWLEHIFEKGHDTKKGFHHPDVRPNRFHARPKYPVKKYMCYGLYWNPVDYLYYANIPHEGVQPFPIPDFFKEFCEKVVNGFSPEAVMVNFYTQNSSMGIHVDKDEEDKNSPIIGVNFGSSCRFFYEDEDGTMKDLKVPANSIYIFGGPARLMRHGVGTIYSNTVPETQKKYFQNKERLNLTFRKVFL